MLISLKVSNLRSIDAHIEFIMEASKETLRQERVADVAGNRVLQVSAIWGGNASGKSNFCEALKYAQHLVVTGTRPDGPQGRVPFRLRKKAAEEATRFEFEIVVAEEAVEKLFRYVFAVDGRHVLEEKLIEVRPSSERVYFERLSASDGEPRFTLMTCWERTSVSEEERMFAKFAARGTRSNQLFLHEAMDRKLEVIAPVFRWFRDQLVILSPDSIAAPLETAESGRDQVRNYITDLLRHADTGITELRPVIIPVASLPIPSDMVEDINSKITDESGVFLMAPNGQRFTIFRKEGDLIASRIVSFRKSVEGEDVPFEMMDESDGTVRLFDLAPSFHDLGLPDSRKVYVIDELDRSMHTHLAQSLLNLFFSTRSRKTRSQLIFTTHDVNLLGQNLFRRDEIWFIGRAPSGAAEMESLSNYRERHDKDIRKSYLEGRYSGVPNLKPFARSRVEEIEQPDLFLHTPRRGTSPAGAR